MFANTSMTIPNWAPRLSKYIEAIGNEDNGAAKLLVVVSLCAVLLKQYESGCFWPFAYIYKHNTLFSFHGASEQYLVWTQSVKRKNKCHLEDTVSGQCQKFFKLDNTFFWLLEMVALSLPIISSRSSYLLS